MGILIYSDARFDSTIDVTGIRPSGQTPDSRLPQGHSRAQS